MKTILGFFTLKMVVLERLWWWLIKDQSATPETIDTRSRQHVVLMRVGGWLLTPSIENQQASGWGLPLLTHLLLSQDDSHSHVNEEE